MAMGTILAAADGADEGETVAPSIEDSLTGDVVDGLSKDYSPKTGEEKTAIPSACWQCVTRDGIVCYVEDGRLTHIEGNPKLRRTAGKICLMSLMVGFLPSQLPTSCVHQMRVKLGFQTLKSLRINPRKTN